MSGGIQRSIFDSPISAKPVRPAAKPVREALAAAKPVREALAAAKPAASDDTAGRLRALLEDIGAGGRVDADTVRSIVAEDTAGLTSTVDQLADALRVLADDVSALRAPKADHFVVQIGQATREIKGRAHKCLPQLIKLAAAKNRRGFRHNILLVGPAGAGKTYAAGQLADTLGLEFAFLSLSAGISESYLIGRYVPTGAGGQFEYKPAPFVEFYRRGGVFLLDEIDAADPNVLLVINAALANGHLRLPTESVTRHADFVLIAAANTFGTGADRQYTGRAQLDAATLDRFAACTLSVDYDEDLEADNGAADVVQWAQDLRRRVRSNGLRRIVSTRLIFDATDLIEAGAATLDDVKRSYLASWSDEELRTVDETRPA